MLGSNRNRLFLVIFVLALGASLWISRLPAQAADRSLVDWQQGSGPTTTYVVQPGDTLSSIARRFATTVTELVRLNKLPNANYIYSGQRLLVPASGGTVPPTPTATQAGTIPPATATATPKATVTVPTATPTQAATATTAITATATSDLTPTATTVMTATTTPTATATITSPWTAPDAAIELFSPVTNTLYHSPIEVIGYSQTFEGNVNLRLTDAEGNVLAERNVMGGSVDGFAFFHSYLRFTVNEEITATLEIFETSAEDGSEINKVTVALGLLPGQRLVDLNTPTTGSTVCDPLVVSGYSNTFEATVGVDLRERDGTVITQTNAMGGNLGLYADFSTTIEPDLERDTAAALLVGAYEVSARDGTPIDQTLVPVTFTATCP